MPIRPRKKPGRTRYLVLDPELDNQFESLFVGDYGQTFTEAIEHAMRRHLANPPPKPELNLPPLPPVTPREPKAEVGEKPAATKKGKAKK